MKRQGNILICMLLSLMVVAGGAGFVIVKCCCKGNMAKTECRSKCCTRHGKHHIAAKPCAETIVMKLYPLPGNRSGECTLTAPSTNNTKYSGNDAAAVSGSDVWPHTRNGILYQQVCSEVASRTSTAVSGHDKCVDNLILSCFYYHIFS